MKITNYPDGKPKVIIKSLGPNATVPDKRWLAEDLMNNRAALSLGDIGHVENGDIVSVVVFIPQHIRQQLDSDDTILLIFASEGTELELVWR